MDANYSSPISVGRQMNYTIVGLKPYSDYELKVRLSFELFCQNRRLCIII